MNISKHVIIVLFLCLLTQACSDDQEIQLPLEDCVQLFTLNDFYSENEVLDFTVDSIYELMTVEEKIGQTIVLSSGAGTLTRNQLKQKIGEQSYGGAVFLGKNRNLAQFTAQLQSTSKWPLLFSLDAEPSLINGRLTDLDKKFANTINTSNEREAESSSLEIAEILAQMGIHQNYAPVVDLSANLAIINTRSYGDDPEDVITKSNRFITEHQMKGVVATSKHFPGHGMAKGDSHKTLVSIDDINEEIEVFQSNIQNEVISIMVGHIAIKNGPFATDGKPSTISKNVVTTLLKNKLGFKGLILTDAMNMKAVSRFEHADLEALKAGNDMVLIPSDPLRLINQVKQEALRSEQFAAQVESSIKKVIRLKVCLGLFKESHIILNKSSNMFDKKSLS